MTGHIYNIQRFSIHDGPGIRTTVFLKGCPLSCKWCHNPESQTNKSVLMYSSSKCIGCYDCISNCPNAALSKEEDISGTPTGLIHIERNRCISCGTCAKVCPAGAIDLLGRPMTVEEILIEIRKDDEFYKSSGGGITVSGGEPLHQSNFTLELVKALKHEKYHVTLDTSGYSEFSTLKNLITYVDLFLFDVKHIDQKKHLKYTGVNNALILRNLKKLTRHGCRVWARIPLIPSFNAEETDMHEIAYSLSDLRVEKVCVLPYHRIASGKYTQLDQTYELIGMKSPSQDEIDRAESILKNYGLNVQIGG